MKELPAQSIHLIITSPPYWNVKNYEHEKQIGYSQSYQEYIDSLNQIWLECNRVLVPNGKICIDIQPVPVSRLENGTDPDRSSIVNIMHDIEHFMRDNKLHLSNIFIWDKRKYNNQMIFGSYPFPPNLYSHIAFEYIYVFRKEGKSRKVDDEIKEKSKISKEEWRDYCFNSIWDIPPVIKFGQDKNDILSHVAPFPIEIPRRLIKLFSFVNDTILDPFLGSGTTLGACALEGRNGIGFELNKDYEDLIKLTIAHPTKLPTWTQAEIMKKNYKLTDFLEKDE
nr:site-specific DNA-methyltransferase [Candidatus Sigynarchaeota archaeon]